LGFYPLSKFPKNIKVLYTSQKFDKIPSEDELMIKWFLSYLNFNPLIQGINPKGVYCNNKFLLITIFLVQQKISS
jgi:hypothetical protein